MRRAHRIGLTLMVIFAGAPVGAQPATVTAAELRTFFFQRDYEGGYRAGLTVAASAARPDVRAWFVANEARYGLTDEATADAGSIDAHSPWSAFARAVASCQAGPCARAVPAARSLVVRWPTRPDFVWLYASVLISSGRAEDATAALAAARRQGCPETAELLALAADALALRAQITDGDSVVGGRAAALFAAARVRDSTNLDTYYFEGINSSGSQTDSATVGWLAHAAALSPYAPTVHSAYWDALLRLRGGSETAARSDIGRDIAVILAGRNGYPGALYLAADGYKALDSVAQRRALRDRVLREYPTSHEADQVLLDRMKDPGDSDSHVVSADTGAGLRGYRDRIASFLERPAHHERAALGQAYLLLFLSEKDDTTVATEALVRAVRGMEQYERHNPRISHVFAPVALANRRSALSYAESLARDADPLLRHFFTDYGVFTKPQQVAQELSFALAEQRDALGWVYVNEGRLAAAGRALGESRALNAMNPLVHYHLGRLAEASGQADTARARYATGYQLELTRRYAGRKNGDALRRLYFARHGSDDGFDAYADTLRQQDRIRRRAAIAASRLTSRSRARSFTLDRIDSGIPIASESLRGKIVVVHFWGVWCGPCVAEMPDFERWYESVRGDTSVVVVAIDFLDADRRAVQRFANQLHLQFPILADDGYVEEVKVRSFPTTWFLDRTGRLAFVANGVGQGLSEEFDWRIDMLRN
jgi:thiol-disulfide isomerase/thioredoxin